MKRGKIPYNAQVLTLEQSRLDLQKANEKKVNIPRRRKTRIRLSTISEQKYPKGYGQVSTYDELKEIMDTTFFSTIKQIKDLDCLKVKVKQLCPNQDQQKEWLQKLENKRKSISSKTLCGTRTGQYKEPFARVVSTPMGGQNKR